MTRILFIDEINRDFYANAILEWLKEDWQSQDCPENHFWHNRDVIESAFDRFQVLVSLNDEDIITGYMTWTICTEVQLEIDIVEVKAAYRRQGLLKTMLEALPAKFPEVVVLTGTVLKNAQAIFKRLGWESRYDLSRKEKFYKRVAVTSPQLDELPLGLVLAVCPVDLYDVKNNRAHFQHMMKYFSLVLGEHNKLLSPVVTTCVYGGYLALYIDKECIVEGKSKHLFNDIYDSTGLLVINKFDLINPKLLSDIQTRMVAHTVAEEGLNMPRRKRPRSPEVRGRGAEAASIVITAIQSPEKVQVIEDPSQGRIARASSSVDKQQRFFLMGSPASAADIEQGDLLESDSSDSERMISSKV